MYCGYTISKDDIGIRKISPGGLTCERHVKKPPVGSMGLMPSYFTLEHHISMVASKKEIKEKRNK
jgi:hypothetical protein